jgi:hypothetical protein
LVREQVECTPPDGSLHVVAFSEPVQDTTTADFAAGYGQLFAEHLPGYEEIDVRDVGRRRPRGHRDDHHEPVRVRGG